MLGMHASRGTNRAMKESDLIIAVGVRFDDRATGKIAEFCPNAKILHLDIDPCEIGKLKKTHLGLVGNVRYSLEMLIPHVAENDRSSWCIHVAKLQQENPIFCPNDRNFNKPYSIILEAAAISYNFV